MKKKQNKKLPTAHAIAPYFLNARHSICINLIGLGGTGSNMLRELVRIHQVRVALGMPGLMVFAWDGDTFSESNAGRQLCFKQDIGRNKAVTLISRVNAAAGTNWRAVPFMYNTDGYIANKEDRASEITNITITCVDTAKARKEIFKHILYKAQNKETERVGMGNLHYLEYVDWRQPYYWLDMGNTKNTGQAILSTLNLIKQPKQSDEYELCSYLPNIFDLFGDIEQFDNEQEQGPSCSMREALERQDLFINASVAQAGAKLLWSLLRGHPLLFRHQIYVNNDTFNNASVNIASQVVPYKYCIYYYDVALEPEQAFFNDLGDALAMAENIIYARDLDAIRIFQVKSKYELGKSVRILTNKFKTREVSDYRNGNWHLVPKSVIETAEMKRNVERGLANIGPCHIRNYGNIFNDNLQEAI